MPVKIFFCYAHEDEALLKELKEHLKTTQMEGLIEVWNDRDINAGMEWEQEISKHLNEAQIILLLVSPKFMNSDYCYSVEMKRALERHERGEARVILIILRHIHWQIEQLNKLQALPRDAKPVVGRHWYDKDEAFLDVVEGIRKVVDELISKSIQLPKLEPISPSMNALKRELVKRIPLPEEISLLDTLEGHSSFISSVTFSPDGQILASGSADKTIKLWGKKSI